MVLTLPKNPHPHEKEARGRERGRMRWRQRPAGTSLGFFSLGRRNWSCLEPSDAHGWCGRCGAHVSARVFALGPEPSDRESDGESDILEQIDRDVKQTHPDIPFFSVKSNQESLRRILIIFSKLNPSVRYVQGMNEVLASLFYVFKNDPDTSNLAAAEADTYFCFVELLSGFRDNYCKLLDGSSVGIRSTLSKLSQLLKRHDKELWHHMEVTTKVYPQYYAFRWITLLLTMEFSLNVCIHIWDAILGDPEGPPDTLLRICCAMFILVRKRLLAGDFTANIQLLQHYPETNIDHLHIANRLRGTVAS